MEIGNAAEWFSGLATTFAACVALYLGLKKPVMLTVSLQPHNIGVLRTNSLDLFINNLGSQIVLVRDIKIQISLISKHFSSVTFKLPVDWHHEANLPRVINGGGVASITLYPSPLGDGPAAQWISGLWRINKRWYQFWKRKRFQKLSVIVELEDGSSYKCVLRGEVLSRMCDALVI